ncbi:MAG: hypothetical protein DYG89_25415 [Caldilinea sp. CFX5]|nr:hypothetical protein [Caldilinea sp. CFX5]
MMKQATYAEMIAPVDKSSLRLGFWIALLTAVAAAAALGLGATTPPRSGPFCSLDWAGVCVTYPYTAVAAYVPRDYYWMYPAFLLGPLFVLLVVCIHQQTVTEKKIFSQIALLFAAMGATLLATNYFIQLAVIQPSLLKGETAGLTLFSQYNPHSIFIALEDLGNLLLGFAFLFVAPVFNQPGKAARFLHRFFTVMGALAVGGFILYALYYGQELEYRYEVFSIMIDWVGLIVAGLLLSIFFAQPGR